MANVSPSFRMVFLLAVPLLVACSSGGNDSPRPNVAASAPCLVRQDQPPPVAPPPGPPQGSSLQLEQVNSAGSLEFPLFMSAPPGDRTRIFVIEKGGRVKILDRDKGSLVSTFIDISSLVSTGGSEQGLLGLAFDPQYATNRRFYLSYTDINGNSVVARFLTSQTNPDVALPTADHVILTIVQPFTNHNGGMITFGQDGFLYIGLGDGGSGGDPGNRAQNLANLLGKLLRIDVSQSGPPPLAAYAVPSSNPCVNQAGVRPEVWSVGLRNPWRFSFDRQSGDLYLADVGEKAREEVNLSPRTSGSGKGLNYGWNVLEGTICFPPGTICNPAGLTQPLVEYSHGSGCSIIGGYVYRGSAIPALQGTYFYSDFCAGFIRSFRYLNDQVTQHFDWVSLNPSENVTSFGEDDQGEIYVMTSQGGLYRIVPN